MYLFDPSLTPALSTNAQVLSGAKMYVYLANTSTLTPSYTDEIGGTEHTNPVVANSAGRFAPVYLDEAIPVRIKVTNAAGSDTLYDAEYIAPPVPAGFDDTIADLEASVAAVTGLFDIGLFDDAVSTPPAIPTTVTFITTSGWDTQGIGAGRYIYDSTLDSADAAANLRTMFEAADGRIFKLDPKQMLHIEMFGGKCDANLTEFYNGTGLTGTDNLAPIDAAMSYTQGEGWTYTQIRYTQPIHFYGGSGQNAYYFSDTIVPVKVVHLKGLTPGTDNLSGTIFRFPADTGGIIIHNNVTNPGDDNEAGGSVIEGIYFLGNGGTDRTAHGIWNRGPVTVRDCVFDNFAGNGSNNVGSSGVSSELPTFGNTSHSRFDRMHIRAAGNHGIYVAGADASASLYNGCRVKEARLCGVYEASSFGNTWVGTEIDNYGTGRVGAVSHGGLLYQLISSTAGAGAANEPGVSPTVWQQVSTGAPSATWPAWSGAGSYEVSLPLFATGDSNHSVFIGTYIEVFYWAHFEGQCPAVALGGFAATTNNTRWSKSASSNAVGALYNAKGHGGYKEYLPAHSTLGTYFEASVGSGDGVIINHRQQSAGDTSWQWKYDGKDTVYQFSSGTKLAWRVTGQNTAITFNRSAGVPYIPVFFGIGMGDESGGTGRIHQSGTAAPGSGHHSQGEIVWNTAPAAAGTLGWVCTTTGTPGTWKAISGIAA